MGLHETDPAIRPDHADTQVGGQAVTWQTDVRTYTTGPKTRYVYFDTMADDELREFAKGFGPGQWHEWSRAQILALLRNRCPGGFVIETEDIEADFHPATRALQIATDSRPPPACTSQEAQAG
jgi:hypothetical protein